MRPIDYGSIYVFLNGFRVPPYGEFGDDWLNLELRKGQGYARFLGQRELVGRIEILDSENDFKVRIERIKEFFADKNKVRVVVVFKGPQMRVKHKGYEVINKIKAEFGDAVITDMEPKFLGKYLMTVLSPVSKKLAKIVKPEKQNVKQTEVKKVDNKKA